MSNQKPDNNNISNNLSSGAPAPRPTVPEPQEYTISKKGCLTAVAIGYFFIVCLSALLIGGGNAFAFSLIPYALCLIYLFFKGIKKLTSDTSNKPNSKATNKAKKENVKYGRKCIKCGKGGLFNSINEDGLCISCVTSQLKEISGKLSKTETTLKNTKTKLKTAEAKLSPEILKYAGECDKLAEIQEKISNLNVEFYEKKSAKEDEYRKEIKRYSDKLSDLKHDVNDLEKQHVELNEAVLLQSYGLYKSQYDFENSDGYKRRLEVVRNMQKEAIKNDTAIVTSEQWAIGGDYKKGEKMIKDMKKLLLRAFNEDCDELVRKVKYNNYEAYKKRMETSCDQISKLGTMLKISISRDYLRYKVDELTLAFEYAQMKQKEKEEQKALKEQMREEAKLLKEIEEERKRLEKEQTHYANALQKINNQLKLNPDDSDLLAKKQELEKQAIEIEKAIKDVDYRQANKRAGYVYVISNIGAFGENVYKIGMTRRLNPEERIEELSSASVPFNFDIHALIFTDDAPTLEAALHKAFEDKKVNMVNQRREFFNVTLDEIKRVVKQNYDKTVEFIDIPDAEQYRISMKMRQQ